MQTANCRDWTIICYYTVQRVLCLAKQPRWWRWSLQVCTYYLPSATNQTNPNENAPVSVEINKTVSDWTWPLNYCEYSTEQSRDCGCSWRETGSENRNVKSHEIYQGQVTFHLMATMLLHCIAIYLLLHSVMQLSTVGSYARRRLYRTFLYSGRNS